MEGQTISLVPPPLLITWRSHLENVVDVLYVDIFQLVVSASEDGDVKIWKLSGDIIGMGTAETWPFLSLSLPLMEHTPDTLSEGRRLLQLPREPCKM